MSDEEEVASEPEETYTDDPAYEDVEECEKTHDLRVQQLDVIEDDEIKSFWEERIDKRQKEDDELNRLRAKRVRRRAEMAEEEREREEKRKQEEERRRKEEEERRHKKDEAERQRRDEKEQQRLEAEGRMKNIGGRNFVINKRDDGGAPTQQDSDAPNEVKQKSKEQLEAEKKAVLAQRIKPLEIDSLDEEGLKAKAKELWDDWYRLESEKYDLDEECKRKQYDLMELAERARQANKGKGRQRGMSIVQIDASFDRLADRFSQAPPKIQLCSKYERHTDHRGYAERRQVFEHVVDAANEGPAAPKKKASAAIEEGDEEAAAEEAPAEE